MSARNTKLGSKVLVHRNDSVLVQVRIRLLPLQTKVCSLYGVQFLSAVCE